MVNGAKLLPIVLTVIPFIMSCNSKQKVDLIVKNARIYSVDSAFSIYQSMAVDNGKIVALGTDEEIEKSYTSKSIYRLEGKPVYPGFIDAHCHFLGYGLSLRNASLSGIGSWQGVVEKLVEHHQNFPSQWVLGRGWNQNEWDVKEFPTNELLDKAFPDIPVLITRIDGHAAIANTKALEMAGFSPDTVVTGGTVMKANGKLTGVLIDNAIDLVRRIVPEATLNEKETALLTAQRNCFAVGLTSVSDAGLDLNDVLLIDEMQRRGDLQMQINAMLAPTDEDFDHFVQNGIHSTPYLTVRTIKLFADGALGSRGALLLEPYSDAKGTRGLQVETRQRLTEICQKAFDAGYQVATHCIGDAAVRLMLDIYEQFLTPGNDLRWRIEHAQIVHPDDLPRFGRLNIIPSVQTTHATSDMIWAADRLGKRIKNAYIYRDLLNQNGWLPNGSDFPIEHINPLYGFYAGVARKNLEGFPDKGFQTENALSREQALKAMTIWAAKASFEELAKGSLEPGKNADFVVMEDDIMAEPIERVPYINVQLTFIKGKKVFGALIE